MTQHLTHNDRVSAAPKLATYETLLALDEDVKAEVIAGLLEVMTRPRPTHGRAQRALSAFVGKPYAGHGVAHFWLVDPDARTLTAPSLRDGQWLEAGVLDDAASAKIPAFDEVELSVGRLSLLPAKPDAAP